ncbi:MAG: DUF5682 family protein [Verrucomicrobiota bacterium]
MRHLSPGASWHLRKFLDEVNPKAVLVEGPADFTELIPEVTAKGVVPPIALLAFTRTLPVRTIVYPFAAYSPEWQAMKWARSKRVLARWIDLPSGVFLGMEKKRVELQEAEWQRKEMEDDPEKEALDAEIRDEATKRHQLRKEIYNAFAEAQGQPDYETYWERHFEQNLAQDTYREAAYAFGQGLRDLEAETPDLDFAENLVREAYMRREIARCIEDEGIAPEKIVVVVGAFHAPNVERVADPMTDEELRALPHLETDLTLMPYSYFRLSRQSGYGAGNQAPAYFDLFWKNLQGAGTLEGLATDYLSQLARCQRNRGVHRSTAEVIEGVRLSRSLAELHGSSIPTLRDLQDGAITLLGHGERGAIAEGLAEIEVGTRIGKLPAGARQTSIQLDFAEQLKQLKLESYRKTVADSIKLDLRENRRVKNEMLAFLDLNRSFFLHRLTMLGIRFGRPPAFSSHSPWFEGWTLQWEPEREIELVEAVLFGDTIEIAAGFRFGQRLEEAKTIRESADLVWEACLCGMPKILQQARERLQEIAAVSSDFVSLADACHRLGQTLKFGDIRNMDLAPLEPLLIEMYHQSYLQVTPACLTDAEGAKSVAQAMAEIHAICDDFHEQVPEGPWLDALRDVALRDDLNPFLSGFGAALLLERNAIEEDDLNDEVSRRLSPGMDADLGAGWFEGLALRNRYGLLSRLSIWETLGHYIKELGEDSFPRALVFLRRAFGGFSPDEKRRIAENLGELWGKNLDQVSEALEGELSEAEVEELNDLDFDDL